MIYLTNGVRQREYKVLGETNGDFYNLVQVTRAPQEALNKTVEQLADYKIDRAPYVIYGEVSGMTRQDDVISRTVLFIDVDDDSDYQTASKQLSDFLYGLDMNYVVYPTISNNIKSGARLRAGVALDRPVTAEEYLKLWSVILQQVKLHGDQTAVNNSFKQLQGLYVQTSQNDENEPIIYDSGRALLVDSFIQIYDTNPEKYQVKPTMFKSVARSGKNTPSWAENNKRFIACLLDPESNYMMFGGWDNMLTALGGWTY